MEQVKKLNCLLSKDNLKQMCDEDLHFCKRKLEVALASIVPKDRLLDFDRRDLRKIISRIEDELEARKTLPELNEVEKLLSELGFQDKTFLELEEDI